MKVFRSLFFLSLRRFFCLASSDQFLCFWTQIFVFLEGQDHPPESFCVLLFLRETCRPTPQTFFLSARRFFRMPDVFFVCQTFFSFARRFFCQADVFFVWQTFFSSARRFFRLADVIFVCQTVFLSVRRVFHGHSHQTFFSSERQKKKSERHFGLSDNVWTPPKGFAS